MSDWYAHELSPFDWWDGWSRYNPEDPVISRWPGPELSDHDEYVRQLLREMYEEARHQFRELGWEGVGDWYFSGFISGRNEGPEFLLAVKQFDNGTVFVLAPIRLPLGHPE